MLKNDKTIKISVGQSRKSITWVTQVLKWSDFVTRLSQVARTNERFADYRSWPKPKQDELKDVGGFVGGTLKGERRKSDTVIDRYLITLDMDNITPGETENVLKIVNGLDCAYAIYSTRKHCSSGPRLRVIIPLDRACTPDEYIPIARKIASVIGLDYMDITTFEPSRLMNWPSASIDSEFVFVYGDKNFVSADGVLKMYKDWKNASEWPIAPGELKLKDKIADKQGEPTEKPGVVGGFCRIYNIDAAIATFLADVYTPCEIENRYTYVHGSTTAGAVVYNNGAFIYSHHATDPAGGKLCNAFDLVRYHKFNELDVEAKPDTPVSQLPSYKAMSEFALKDEAVTREVNKERYAKAMTEFNDGTTNVDQAKNESKELTVIEDTKWMDKLDCNPITGAPQKTIANVLIILKNDPALKNSVVFDEFTTKVKVKRPLPWDTEKEAFKERIWDDTDDAGLRYYVEKLYRNNRQGSCAGCILNLYVTY
jgi:F0F1-type ATP synthase delta subunit